jgi:hypothetical protein
MTQTKVVQELEKFLRDRLRSSITKVDLGEIVYFRIEDIVYKDDALTQKVKVWWANISIFHLVEGPRVAGELLVDNIYRSFTWDDMRRAQAIDGYRQTFNKICAELEKFGAPETKSVLALDINPPPIYADDLEKVRELSMIPLTVQQIATRLAISESTVKRYRKQLGIQRRKGMNQT